MLCASLLLLVPLGAPQDATPAPLAPAGVLTRVAFVGASLTDGFGLSTELDAPMKLAGIFALALPEADSLVVHDLGDSSFFSDPEGAGRRAQERAQTLEPTLVVAADFLFWYAYGYLDGCEPRSTRLQAGLDLLAAFECPVVVGDLPDMSPALKGRSPMMGGRPLLAPQQIPTDRCLAALNARIGAWAKERPNVHVFPLSRFAAIVHEEGVFELRGNRYDDARKQTLMQEDLLHPTARGAVAAVLSLLDTAATAELIDPDLVRWDAEALEKAIWEATAKEREEKAQRGVKREERRKRREAKKGETPSPEGGNEGSAPEGGDEGSAPEESHERSAPESGDADSPLPRRGAA